jgi:hypothetical protein
MASKKDKKELEKKEAEIAPEAQAPETKADGKKETTKEAEENAQADAILKLYPGYAELYIDSRGGVFAPGTPAHIRGNARLYKNKYHQ